MSKGVLLVVFAFALMAVSYGSEVAAVPVSHEGPGARPDKELPLPTVTGRSLLSGPADAFDKATKPHHHTKESSRPSKTTGVSGSSTTAINPSSNTLGGASSVQGGHADAFNKATRSRHSRKEIPTPSKATGIVPTKPQQPTAGATTPPSTTTTPRQLLDTTSTHSGPTETPNKAHHKIHLHRTSKKAPAPSRTTTKPQEPIAAAGTPPSKTATPRQLLDTVNTHWNPSEVPNKAHHILHVHRTSKKTPAPTTITTKNTGDLPINSKPTTQRTLLGGPADAFNKATHSHHATKETTLPGKSVGVTPDQPQQPTVPPPAPAKQQPVSTASTQTVPTNMATKKAIHARHPTEKASAAHDTTTGPTKRTLLGTPADAFNKATHSHHDTKETGLPGKVTGVSPDQPQQQPTPASAPAKQQPVSTANKATLPPANASKKAIRTRHTVKKTVVHDTPTGANKRTLLDSAADAFNKASRSHHATKEAALPGKDTGVTPDQPQQPPTSASSPPKRNLLSTDSTQSGPVEAFKKAYRARHASKEAPKPDKTTGARPTTTPSTTTTTTGSMPAQSAVNLQKPHSPGSHAVTEPGSRALLQWGWSGSAASASASAQAGSGGWGGNSWSGAQAQAQAQSQSFGGGYGGFGGYGWGRKLRAAASSVDI